MTDWKTTPGAALTSAEREYLYNIAEQTYADFAARGRKVKIVNIGIGPGASVHCLTAGAPRATIYAIDISLAMYIGESNAEVILGRSTDPKTMDRVPGTVHLIFIDGSHEFQDVYNDAWDWWKRLAIGGRMVFHDYINIQTMQILRDGIAEVKPAIDRWALDLNAANPDSWDKILGPDSLVTFKKLL